MKAPSQNNLIQDNAPLGEPVDTTPAKLPEPVTLRGHFGRIEPFDAKRHGSQLWQALKGHDELWAYMRCGPFADEEAFNDFMLHREAKSGRAAYTVIDSQDKATGTLCLMDIRPEDRIIEMGSVIYAPCMQKSALGTEAQYLMMKYVFDDLGYRRYEWRCNARNQKSRIAALRYGFTFEGVFRQDAIVKGCNRDTAFFSIIDKEWPALKQNFERWLKPDNFDAAGRQKHRLEDLR